MKQTFKRIVLSLWVLILVGSAGGAAWIYWRSHACLPRLEGSTRVPGLAAQVEVLRDAHGVPHLRAQSLDDLLFAQGYATAQDRLWQMDLSRRLAEGRLSEIFGERALRYDIENRTLGLGRVAERETATLDADIRKHLEAYARGVNAFIEAHRQRLPIEFLLLRYQPGPWRVADSLGIPLNMAKILSTSWQSELMRERIHTKLQSEELYADLFPDHSPLDHPVAEWPPSPRATARGAWPCAPSARHLGGGAHGHAPLPHDTLGALIPRAASDESTPPTLPGALNTLIGCAGTGEFTGLGSNNWVISGAHTKSGKPLLANDPHLGHSIPSVWYMIHLEAPGLNVSGVSLPGLPGVVIGHNERIAWGMTNTGTDVQDLYVESFNFRDPNKYLHNGEWVEAEVRDEAIPVRQESDYRLAVKVTRHGPVVSHEGDRDLALMWTALQPGALSTLARALFKLDQAQNWEEFTAALRDFTGPMQNFVFGDRDGNIGYYAAGWVPIRKSGNGSLPSTGSSDEHDWAGYVPFEELPHSYNPSGGIIATANGRIVPDNYPYLITTRWEPPYRTSRIYQLLEAGNAFDVPDMLRIQTDIHPLDDTWLAQQLVQAGSAHPPGGSDAQYALSLLRQWDGEARADSAATLVCELTWRTLLHRLLSPKLGDDLSVYAWPMSHVFIQNVFANNATRWLPPGDASLSDTLIKSLKEAVGEIPAIVHSRRHEAWRWGDTIPLTFHHPLSGGFPLLGRILDVGPFPQAGTLTTVKSTTMTMGPSMHLVVDFSNLDNSVQNITLGESGQRFSPYYRDQFNAWYTGRSFPMPFSGPAVEKAAVHRLVLEPGP